MSQSNKKMLAAGAVMVGLSSFVPNPFTTGEAMAQMTATTNLNMTASVVNPLSVSQQTPLNFGVFAINGGGTYDVLGSGTASIAPADGFTVNPPTAGSVQVVVPSGATFTLTVPKYKTATRIKLARTTTTTGATAKKILKIERLFIKGSTKIKTTGGVTLNDTARAAPNNDIQNLNLVGTGTAIFKYGGRLEFGAVGAQDLGAYTGTFTFLTTL